MRDPKRISQMMNLIQRGWEEMVPDWRFGQLIENLKRHIDADDLFYIEDDKMMEVIAKFFGLEENDND